MRGEQYAAGHTTPEDGVWTAAYNSGKYIIVEVKSPAGYLLDSTPMNVSFTYPGQNVAYQVVKAASTNLRTTAKELVVPERQFVRFLLEQRFVYRTASGNVLPYAKPSNDGLFCVKDFCNHGHIGSYTLVTPQGKLHFAELRDLILMVV